MAASAVELLELAVSVMAGDTGGGVVVAGELGGALVPSVAVGAVGAGSVGSVGVTAEPVGGCVERRRRPS